MKKSLFYFAAFLALASCAKNEVTELRETPVNSNAIGFNTYSNATRGVDLTADELKTGFNVIAFKKDGSVLFTKDDVTHSSEYKFITNTSTDRDNKWGWTIESDDKKWPTGDVYPLTFIAAFPKLGTDVLGPWVVTGETYEQAIEISNDITTNIDLLAANQEQISKPANGIAELHFAHILSKIKFQIITPENYKVFVQQITIKQVAKDGRDYDYKASTYSTEPSPYQTTSLADFKHLLGTKAGTVKITGKANAAATDVTNFFSDATSAGQTWKMMPQTTVAAWDKATFADEYKKHSGTWDEFITAKPTILDGAMIEVIYRMEDEKGKSIVGWKTGDVMSDGVTSATVDYFVKVGYPLDLSAQATNGKTDKGWLPGFQYTYQIKLGTPDASNGTVIDPDWVDEDGTETDKPVDNPENTKPGEDISKEGYIGFDVIVDAWEDATGTEIK